MLHDIADRPAHFTHPARAPRRESATPPAVLASVLTLVETAQLVQRILNEAFPETPFTVSVTRNEHGSQLMVGWTDGPRDLQVARLILPLQAIRLCDGGRHERVEHFMVTPAGRHTIRLAADRIALSRQFSDRAIEQALARLASRYADYLTADVRAAMTVAAYRADLLHGIQIHGVHRTGAHRSGSNLQTDVDALLDATTSVRGFPRSITAARLFVRRDVH